MEFRVTVSRLVVVVVVTVDLLVSPILNSPLGPPYPVSIFEGPEVARSVLGPIPPPFRLAPGPSLVSLRHGSAPGEARRTHPSSLFLFFSEAALMANRGWSDVDASDYCYDYARTHTRTPRTRSGV